ncbi:TPC1 [Symbiodinium microadriaticum]|nr:TPC1 [Symbiodinium microadriaticum]
MALAHDISCASSFSSIADERGKEAEVSPVEIAAVWLHKATKGSDKWLDCCSRRQLQYYMLRRKLRPLTLAVKHIYLLLAIFEEPSWCLAESSDAEDGVCLDKPGLYSWNLHILPKHVSNSIELLRLCYLVMAFWMRSQSGDGPFRRWWHLVRKVLVSIAIADCVAAMFRRDGLVPGTFRLSRLCRPLIYISSRKTVRSTISRLWLSFLDFWEVLAALAACILVFAWMGVIIFSRSDEGVDFFRNWPVALSSLWILFTTANFPDVMVPSYTDTRATFMFFLLYLVVSLYLLNNILLAAAYDAYKVQLVGQLQKFQTMKAYSVGKAFRLLASETGAMKHNELQISKERWVQFVLHYYALFHHVRSERDRRYVGQKAYSAFLHLDVDCSGRLSEDEFKSVLEVLSDPNIYIPTRPFPRASETCLGRRLLELFQDGIRHPVRFTSYGRQVSGLAAPWLQSSGEFLWEELKYDSQKGVDWFLVVMTAITIFFVLEMSLRMLVLGPARFWYRAPHRNRFDFVSNAMLIIMEVAAYVYSSCQKKAPDYLVRTILVIHIMRSVCLAQRLKPLRYLVALVVRLLPLYSRLGMVLLSTFYIFATIGEPLFGGRLYKGNPRLQNSFFAASHYWALNFNDILSGFVTLFSIMMVNNWFVIAGACILVTTEYSAIFFICFFVIVNLIVLNILIALILESSQAVREELQEPIELDLTLEDAQLPGSREVLLQRMLMSEDHSKHRGSASQDLMKYTSEGQILVNGETTSAESESGSTDGSEK